MSDSRLTFLESLGEAQRSELLDMAVLVQQGPNRAHSFRSDMDGSLNHVNGDDHPSVLPSSPPGRISRRPLDSCSLYMKSIWQLRHNLTSLSIDHKSITEQLETSEKRNHAVETNLLEERRHHADQVQRLTEQIEELIGRGNDSQRQASDAIQREQGIKYEQKQAERNLMTLRTMLAKDLARGDGHCDANDDRLRRLLQRLATDEFVRASEPPEDYRRQKTTTPTDTHRYLTAERDRLATRLEEMMLEQERRRDEHRKAIKERDEQKARLNKSLTGAARRIQWLLDEKQKGDEHCRSLGAYATKIERKLLKQHDELERLRRGSIRKRRLKPVIECTKDSSSTTIQSNTTPTQARSRVIDSISPEPQRSTQETMADSDRVHKKSG